MGGSQNKKKMVSPVKKDLFIKNHPGRFSIDKLGTKIFLRERSYCPRNNFIFMSCFKKQPTCFVLMTVDKLSLCP